MKTARSLWVAIAVTVVAAAAAGVATAAKPVSGTIGGPVTAVSGQTFTLKSSLSPKGHAKIHVASKTVITQQVTGTHADLKKGACIVALGQKNKQGVVQAARVMLSPPVKGSCTAGFGGRPGGTPGLGAGQPPQGGGQPPQGSRPPGNSANFGFAAGAIAGVKGLVVTVHGRNGSTKVAVQAKTQIVKTATAGFSAVKVGLCAFVQGTSSDKGANVDAQNIRLFKPTSRGCIGA
jgi:Domain of unknown function (DUF5666)